MHMKMPRFQLAHRGSALDFSKGFPRVSDDMQRTLVLLAVGTYLVALEFDEILERYAILFRAIGGRVGPPRHGGAGYCV